MPEAFHLLSAVENWLALVLSCCWLALDVGSVVWIILGCDCLDSLDLGLLDKVCTSPWIRWRIAMANGLGIVVIRVESRWHLWQY